MTQAQEGIAKASCPSYPLDESNTAPKAGPASPNTAEMRTMIQSKTTILILLIVLHGCSGTSTDPKPHSSDPVAVVDHSEAGSPVQVAPRYEIVPGKGIPGFEIGDAFEKAVQRFGTSATRDGNHMKCPDEGIDILRDDKGRVRALFLYFQKPNYAVFEGKSNKGIGVTSTTQDVLQQYGKPSRISERTTRSYDPKPGVHETYISYARQGISFTFWDGSLAEIDVRAEQGELPDNPWFREQIQGDVPVLIDFTATWCPPCAPMAENLHKIQDSYGSRLKLVEVDIDKHRDIPVHFEVSALPDLFVIQNGKVVKESLGLRSYEQLVELLTPIVGQP